MMQTGALIVAAGKSSRMGDFKPMLQLGSISIAQRVINNFRQAGVTRGCPRESICVTVCAVNSGTSTGVKSTVSTLSFKYSSPILTESNI